MCEMLRLLKIYFINMFTSLIDGRFTVNFENLSYTKKLKNPTAQNTII